MSELKPVKKIELQEWMARPDTQAVMKALGEGSARFVGGCVRNTLMGFDVGDIDIATLHTPEEATKLLEGAGIKVVPTGIEHGTVTAIVEKKPFEITTLRKDVETDGRRAVVAFTKDWREDSQRRDFTINTLLADVQGNIYDPTGEGLADSKNHKIRFVGDAKTRIAEDYLRILRFFRFHALYGKGAPDDKGLKACRAAAGKIATLSKERITQEFFKILSVENPSMIIKIMFENNILNEFSFVEYQHDLFSHLCVFQNRYELAFIAARLFCVAGFKIENVQIMEKLLLIPKVFKKDIEAIDGVLKLRHLDTDAAVREAVYRFGRTPTAQALMIEVVQDRVMNGYAPGALEIIQKWDIPQLPVDGEDLKKAGIVPGPIMGQKLTEIEEWWIAEDFKADKQGCLNRV